MTLNRLLHPTPTVAFTPVDQKPFVCVIAVTAGPNGRATMPATIPTMSMSTTKAANLGSAPAYTRLGRARDRVPPAGTSRGGPGAAGPIPRPVPGERALGPRVGAGAGQGNGETGGASCPGGGGGTLGCH